MIALAPESEGFQAITGSVVFISFLVFAFAAAPLRYHVDVAKFRKEEDIAASYRLAIPPEHVLTAVGKRRAKVAKIALLVFAATVATMVVRVHFLTW